MSIPVLVVDDDTELTDMLGDYLAAEGFAATCAHDGAQGADLVVQGGYALVVLDLMLPSLNGFDVLRRIRQTAMTPVLMLTARGDDLDRIVGLDMGADDYLAKPFNPRELVARMRAILRRFDAGSGGRAQALAFGPLEIDAQSFHARLDGAPLPLTGTEFRILEMLAREAGQIVAREALAQAVLGRRLQPFDRSIDTHISNIRRKLAGAGKPIVDIKNIRGHGYVLVSQPPDDAPLAFPR